MKKILYIIFAVATIFASCTKEENGGEQIADDCKVTISAVPEVSMANEPGTKSVQTRGTATCNRYVIELYADAAYNTMIGTQQSTTDGNFTLTLERSKTYYVLLWADNNASAIYDVTSLKAVKLKTGQLPAEAFYGRLTIAGNQANYDVSLKRAVAKLNLNETSNLPKGSVTVKYNQQPAFNAVDGTTSGIAAGLTATVTTTADITGTKTAPVTLNTDQPIYVLASTAAANVDFTLQYKDITEISAETEFTVTAPVQANYNTNIKGHFTTVVPIAKVGDFYYKNGTWSSTNKATADNPIIGVVFVVNADGKSGKIVSLDSGIYIAWSSEEVLIPGADSKTDGEANTAAITSYSGYSPGKYPAVAWCVAKNTQAIAGINWYLPARDELAALYGTGGSVKNTVNQALAKVGGMTLGIFLWTSTQLGYNGASFFNIESNYELNMGKTAKDNVRAISAFKSNN